MMESLVSFDTNSHFKKMTGGTSQGWVTMASVAKPTDVQSFTTAIMADPGNEVQDHNPFYAINRNETITSAQDLTASNAREAPEFG